MNNLGVLMKSFFYKLLFIAVFQISVTPAYAAHPLVTEDTGTQGIGGNQVEVNTDWLKDEGVKSRTSTVTLTRGIQENLDVFFKHPLRLVRAKWI
jgi:hypothetical protein